MFRLAIQTLLFFTLFIQMSEAQDKHVELGDVQWLRNYDEAVKRAEAEDKDIFILFQEVPGCSTCRNYGKNLLTHPLIVETIEDQFIPLAIFNNHKGHDREILTRFNEPTWNNPVARIVNAKGNDVVDRLSGNYSMLGLISLLEEGISARKVLVPKYLSLLRSEYTHTEELVLGMYCFWEGEKVIGNMPGVSTTEAGWMSGYEVVKVKYDPDQIAAHEIIEQANKRRCADVVFSDEDIKQNKVKTKTLNHYRIDRQDKYYLNRSKYKDLKLTKAQSTKVNSYLAQGLDPEEWLSGRQIGEVE